MNVSQLRNRWLTGIIATAVIAAVCLLAAPLESALPPLSNDELHARASHIVTAEVVRLYTSHCERRPGWIDTLYCLEVEVLDAEKGQGSARGRLLYVRCWTMQRRPRGWAGPVGQCHIPGPADRVRLFMRKDDAGGFDLLMPNGVRVLESRSPEGTGTGMGLGSGLGAAK